MVRVKESCVEVHCPACGMVSFHFPGDGEKAGDTVACVCENCAPVVIMANETAAETAKTEVASGADYR